MNAKTLPIPPHFDPKKADKVWRVPYQETAVAAAGWAKQHNVRPAATDNVRVCLMCIDVQNTFCLPDFELFVGGRSGRGAVDDNVRLCNFVYANFHRITECAATMDTHTAMQLFHPAFWVAGMDFTDPMTKVNYKIGDHPLPFTMISVEDVEKGRWRINPGIAYSVAGGNLVGLQRHAAHYVRKLAATGKYLLTVWPYHAMLGGISHALVASVEEALFFHNAARRSQTDFQIKGGNPLTENYSVLSPEVLDTAGGAPIAQKNAKFIEKLLKFDVVIIGGQAKSHCVAWTIDNLLGEINAQDPKLARKVYLLEDCTSPVVVPGVIDFTDDADKAFQRFRDAGMHVVKSTDPIESWPGLVF